MLFIVPYLKWVTELYTSDPSLQDQFIKSIQIIKVLQILLNLVIYYKLVCSIFVPPLFAELVQIDHTYENISQKRDALLGLMLGELFSTSQKGWDYFLHCRIVLKTLKLWTWGHIQTLHKSVNGICFNIFDFFFSSPDLPRWELCTLNCH